MSKIKEDENMKIYLVDDDPNIIRIIKQIIKDRDLGFYVGNSKNGKDALEDIMDIEPDVVIVDLLMPDMDGITLISRIKEKFSHIQCIMLSQVMDKKMIEKAYDAGVEFYISKPINAKEIESVIRNVTNNFAIRNLNNDSEYKQSDKIIRIKQRDEIEIKLRKIFNEIGIAGEIGSKDIINIIKHLIDNNKTIRDYTIKELCNKFTSNPKSMEQRIRRTANTALVNIANLGIEDYLNDTFTEYSNSIFNFEQVKLEMDRIRGRRDTGGKVNLKKFIAGILFYVER